MSCNLNGVYIVVVKLGNCQRTMEFHGEGTQGYKMEKIVMMLKEDLLVVIMMQGTILSSIFQCPLQ